MAPVTDKVSEREVVPVTDKLAEREVLLVTVKVPFKLELPPIVKLEPTYNFLAIAVPPDTVKQPPSV